MIKICVMYPVEKFGFVRNQAKVWKKIFCVAELQ